MSTPLNLSNHQGNDWSPAIASGPSGIHVAFDSYRNGNYDVFVASVKPGEKSEQTLRTVADSSKFEARPAWPSTLAGGSGSPTRASENWGKDFVSFLIRKGPVCMPRVS